MLSTLSSRTPSILRSAAASTTGSAALRRSHRFKSTEQQQKRTWTTLTQGPDALTVHALNDTSFPYVWLRDACQSPESVHPSTKQKLTKTVDVDEAIRPGGEAGVLLVAKESGNDFDGIEIAWTDGHRSTYTKEFLERYASKAALQKFHHDDALKRRAWIRDDVLDISTTPDLFVQYKDVDTPEGKLRAVTQLVRDGLVFVKGVPTEGTVEGDRTGPGECELKTLAEKFGEIRETFYGKVWDVVSRRDSKNIAYTDLDLGLHQDLLYFENPPRYQVLHCLRNRVVGGTSIFVDSLRAAACTRRKYPAEFDLLTKTPVAFHYINDGHHLHQTHPTIQTGPSQSLIPTPPGAKPKKRIAYINYSPPFQAPLPLDTPKEFYGALKKFVKYLEDKEARLEYTLEEGDAVIFDNRRVLHARTAFKDRCGNGNGKAKQEDDAPRRWLKGCYIEGDAVMDKLRVLRTKLGHNL
ncbi:unnamed protein product [Cyclocybe aegerita]|uniref:Gamma-butyrobetaine dioxygenase n=1 Tax=Cyclocybe aegerita TaxID=1973307 RepID=A0A8S0WMT8_CYCAE|nr:unnamed protein product [Cyclocybe aegerita]